MASLGGTISVDNAGRSPAPSVEAGISILWPLGMLAAVLYGSWIPFEFNWLALNADDGFGLFQLGFRGTTVEDVVTNLLVYVPVGLTLILCGARTRIVRLARLPLVVLAGALISLLAETVQFTLAARVASLTDVLLNIVGTAVGAGLGLVVIGDVARLGRWVVRELEERPFPLLVRVLAAGLLLYGVCPFDFVTDTAGLHEAFRRANWTLFSSAAASTAGHPLWTTLANGFTGAAWFGLLGFLLAAERRSAACSPLFSWSGAVAHGAVLAFVVETLQLFTESHVFDLGSLMIRLPAVSLGAWFAAYVLDCRGTTLANVAELAGRTGRVGRAVPGILLATLAVFQIVALQEAFIRTGHFSIRTASLASVHWMPFEALWHRPMAVAAGSAVSTTVAFLTLSLTIAFALRFSRVRPAWPITAVTVLLTAVSVEILQLATPTHTADITGPVLALIALIAAWRVVALLSAVRPRPAATR